VLTEVTGRLQFIHEYLTTDASGARLEGFVRTMLRPLSEQLGFAPVPADTDDRRALRAVVIRALGTTGNDDEIVRQARAALDRALAGRTEENAGSAGAPDATLDRAIVQVAAEHGDGRLFDDLFAAAARAGAPDERHLYLLATAAFRDPAIIERALPHTVSPEVRPQDTARYLAAFLDNPVARPRAWSFIKSNWSTLEPRLRISNARFTLVDALASFCDAAARDDIRAFFETNRVQGIAGVLSRSIEQADNCIDLREKHTKPVADWLASRP
jgi:aminopeptidase N